MGFIYIDGVFDLFHPGHISYLKKVKEISIKENKKLLVGLISDTDCVSYKRKPIFSHNERFTLLSACRLPDKVIKDVPLIITKEFIEDNNIDIVIHADDNNQKKFFEIPINMGIMKYIPYTNGISTTDIIRKISKI